MAVDRRIGIGIAGSVVGRFTGRPKEGFATFHASFQSFGTGQTDIGMTAGQDHGRSIGGIKFIKANNAMKGHDRSHGTRHGRWLLRGPGSTARSRGRHDENDADTINESQSERPLDNSLCSSKRLATWKQTLCSIQSDWRQIVL